VRREIEYEAEFQNDMEGENIDML